MKLTTEKTRTAQLPARLRGEKVQTFGRPIPSMTINTWIRDFEKWIGVIGTWKQEAGLIDRLVTLSLIGEERNCRRLQELQRSLIVFIMNDVKGLEEQILGMQQNLDLLRRCVISSDAKVKECKVRMKLLSDAYSKIKNSILKELADVYPVRFE